MSQAVDYVFNGQSYTTLELARQAATSFEAAIFSKLDRFCKITVVEPHHKIPNAFTINNQLIDFDCRTLDDNDLRHFNITAVVTGEAYQGVRAAELKQRHREIFETYVLALQLRFVRKISFPSRLVSDPDSSIQESDVFNEEIFSSNASFEYG